MPLLEDLLHATCKMYVSLTMFYLGVLRAFVYLYARRVHYIGPTHASVLAGGGVALRLQLLG